MIKHKSLIQFIKFGIVGISNTLLTALTIWILLKVLHCSDYFSNFAGYIVGLLNSFIWNRKWTFESKTKVSITLFKFIVTFAISYLFQLGNLYVLLHFTHIDSYICQLISIVVYTFINFILNKNYTFKN
jgi:putative flippase GtrA